ncbi:poly [ADP-ribose] polymerase tankyrase-2-like [Gigantopelta aegis]|uniref:poly [ADP-ribose] polymerase tankyrase-2-like n=1 Tax=Gigantopelta aegis TaxID=1735272 RepID=UPI001B88C183|nr:poly [ADP-ribose] polymerase tankyrase-2-like [Gigantopelta aegis]
MASYLVKKGAIVNIQTKSGNTPLHSAVNYMSLEMVRYLVKKEAQINIQNQCGKSPVDNAAQDGSLKIVCYFVEKRALTETEKYTSLIDACLSGEIEVVELLLEKGADPNYGSITAMHIAAGLHSTDILQVLLDKGGDMNALTNSGNTPLHVAMRYDLKCKCSFPGIKQMCIDYLLCDDPHCKPEKQTEIVYDRRLYLYNFEDGAEYTCNTYSKYSVYENLDPEPEPEPEPECHFYGDDDDIYDFPAYDLPKKNDVLIVHNTGDWLLENGCHIDAQNKAGQTALHVCVVYCQLENLKFLLKRGADVSLVDNDGNSVLHYAVDRLHVEAVETLIESGAVDIKNNDGVTASDLLDRKVECLDEAKCFKIISLLTKQFGSCV